MYFVTSCAVMIMLFVFDANNIVIPPIAWIFGWILFAISLLSLGVNVSENTKNKK